MGQSQATPEAVAHPTEEETLAVHGDLPPTVSAPPPTLSEPELSLVLSCRELTLAPPSPPPPPPKNFGKIPDDVLEVVLTFTSDVTEILSHSLVSNRWLSASRKPWVQSSLDAPDFKAFHTAAKSRAAAASREALMTNALR